jgi:hypothetical protein
LQRRIDAALREPAEDREGSRFSDYLPGPSTGLARKLAETASAGGAEGIERALDEFDRLRREGDLLPLQRALMIFLTHYPEAARLGLRVPDLEARNVSQVLPSRRQDKT